NDLVEDFQALRAQLNVQLSDARDVAARPGEALDQAHPQWIVRSGEDDRDPRGCHLCRLRGLVNVSTDDVHPLLDQLTSGGRKGRQISLRKANASNDLLVLTIAQLQQTISQAHYGWCGPPAWRQHPNFDGLGTLLSAHAAGEQPAAYQEHDESNVPLPPAPARGAYTVHKDTLSDQQPKKDLVCHLSPFSVEVFELRISSFARPKRNTTEEAIRSHSGS